MVISYVNIYITAVENEGKNITNMERILLKDLKFCWLQIWK